MKRDIRWRHDTQDSRIVATAQVCSRNGGFGCVWVIRDGDGFRLEVASETTGRAWKSPDTVFGSRKEAKAAAEERWYPA